MYAGARLCRPEILNPLLLKQPQFPRSLCARITSTNNINYKEHISEYLKCTQNTTTFRFTGYFLSHRISRIFIKDTFVQSNRLVETVQQCVKNTNAHSPHKNTHTHSLSMWAIQTGNIEIMSGQLRPNQKHTHTHIN